MFTIQQIEKAHTEVRTGADFPNYIQVIKELGVVAFETWVVDSHTVYMGDNGFKTESLPQYESLVINDECDNEVFGMYLQSHQQGKTDYYQFCKHCAETGVEKWIVNLEKMICSYFDKAGNKVLVEGIPV